MGLDTTHDCWHGPYSAFSRWRNNIARAAGYAVWNVKYENNWEAETIMLDWGHLPPGHLHGDWKEIPDDPLLLLLTHSDCDGLIKSEHCCSLAHALEKLLPELETDHPYKSDRERAEEFIAGLREAAAKGEDVEFH